MDSPLATTGGREGLGRLGVKLYRYRNLLIRHWWILAITIGIGLAYQAWSVSQKPRGFESSSQLLIREELSGNVTSQAVTTTGGEDFIGTQMAILKSGEVQSDARTRLALDFPQLTGTLQDVETSVIPRTRIFVITGTGSNPEYIQHYVDATVASFIENRRRQNGSTVETLINANERKVAELDKDVAEADATLQEYVAKNEMQYWEDQNKTAPLYLSDLKTREAKIQTELKRLTTIDPDKLLVIPPTATGVSGGESAGSSDTGAAMTADLSTTYLQRSQELSAAQLHLEEKSKIWKPKHPRLQVIKDEVAAMEHALETIKKQNRDATAERIDAYKTELLSLAENIKTWQGKVTEASDKNKEYQKLLTAKTTKLAERDQLRLSTRELALRPRLDVFTILQKATPGAEVSKKVMRHLGMGAIAGLVIGFLILALLDRADDRMTSSSEILEQFSEPILGQIPNVAESRGVAGLPLLQPDDERYTYAEAFRSLRSSLIFMPNQTELRTILITSAIPNEGKSTIASNLGITMAAAGASVALIDADLRRGDLASLFDIDGRTGLSNVLRGEVTWESAIQRVKYPNLAVMPRGPVTNQSSELLLLPSLAKLLDDLRENFDVVIFNTAPILATDDTPSLSPNFDGTLMIMRAQFTSARLTQNALNALYQRQVNVLGLVLNCVDTEMPDYYYYRYPKYYAAQ